MSQETERRILEELSRIKELLQGADEILDLDGACSFLRCSKGYMYSMTSKRVIPFSKAAGKLRFSKHELKKWLMSNAKPTADAIAEQIRQKHTAEGH